MNFKFLKIKKSFKKESFAIDPNLYWRFVSVIAIVSTIFLFGVGFSAFKDLNKESPTDTSTTQEEKKLSKKERIDEILEYFEAREIKSQEIISSPSEVIDPSL
jgi:hypothetical protein